MEQKNYTGKNNHYDKMMDAHKMTGRLFGFIPFRFSYVKNSMIIIMISPIFLISFLFSLNIWASVIIMLLFILINSEYNRVYDLRDEIVTECIYNQVYFEADIENGVPQLEDAPNYIDQFDIEAIFDEAIANHKKTSFHIFERMFNMIKLLFI